MALQSDHSTEKLLERITIDPEICHGKPCIRGLRYPVEMILTLLSGDMSIEDILDDYEDLEKEDILAALAFGARLSQVKRDAGDRTNLIFHCLNYLNSTMVAQSDFKLQTLIFPRVFHTSQVQ